MLWSKVKNNLYRTKFFWLSKKWAEDKPLFSFWKTVFRSYYNTEKEKDSFYLLLSTLPSFVRAVIYAAFVIVLLESYNNFFPVSISFDKQAIDSFLVAVASITGIFLGLYFTAISGIASNFLIRATQDVRHFFLASPRRQQYVSTIAFTSIISVFYLVTKSFGHEIHPIGLGFLALLVAYIVIRFWDVGSAVFNSLEPRDSLPWVTKEIADAIKRAAKWQQPFLQDHQRRLASYNLELADNLITFGIRETKLSGDQLLVALRYIGGIMIFCADNKSRIPTNSFWYKTKNKFESWTLASSTEITIALNTGTPINPKTIKDFTWLEEQSLNIAVKILRHLIDENKTGIIFQGHEVFVEVAENYGKDFDHQSLKLLFKKLEDINNSIYSIKPDETQQHIYKEQLAFIDSQGCLAIAALLGLIKYLDKKSCKEIVQTISSIKWAQAGNIYTAGLPLAVLPRLESISNELKNEKTIEGKIVSSEWYIRTLCVQQYLFSLQKYFEYLKSLHDNYFQPKLEKLFTENQLAFAVQLIQRWIEFSNKYSRLVYMIKKHVKDCSKFHQLKDLPWPDFHIDQEIENASNREKEVINKLVQLLPKLKTLAMGDDLPDYFGQALTSGIEACYESCKDNDSERLKKILPAVLDASLAAHEKTRQKVQDWSEEESKIIYSTEPLVNLFEISGYVKLYSELYQNPELWKVAKQLWDVYLNTVENANGVIKFIAAIVNYRSTVFKIMPQATLRANWQIVFGHKMRERGLPVFPDSRGFFNRDERPDHPSPLIRVIARSGGLIGLDTGQEVFFATYLSQYSAAEGISFPNRHEFLKRIQHEEQEVNNQNNENQ